MRIKLCNTKRRQIKTKYNISLLLPVIHETSQYLQGYKNVKESKQDVNTSRGG